MGCVPGREPVPPPSMFECEQEPVEALSYSKRTEKIANELNPDQHAVWGGGFWQRRRTLEKKHHRDRVTPKNLDLSTWSGDDSDCFLPTTGTIDLRAIMDSERHWRFPKWGHYQKCTFCGCECHARMSRQMRRSTMKNNALHRTASFIGLSLDTPHCQVALGNLLAMGALNLAVPASDVLLKKDHPPNALDLTAPASDALLKNRKNAWIQLSGHPGAFAPAGPHTIWKKRLTKENTETVTYQSLMNDLVKDLIPRFYRQVEYNDDYFIEIEDLLQHFRDPAIMDIKMGTRTFLESEVKNPVLRKDLYEKMMKLDPDQPTQQEHEDRAITKLRYMQFREQGSSTSTLGFRIEAAKLPGQDANSDLKKIKTREEVMRVIGNFIEHNNVVRLRLLERFREIQYKFSLSPFFKNHEIIGSSVLIMYDKDSKAGAWMIDFAKVIAVDTPRSLTHRAKWAVGNHEDGYLTGLDNLIGIFEELETHQTKPSNLNRDEPSSSSSSSSSSSTTDKREAN